MRLAAILAAGILLQQSPPFRSQANVTAIDVTVTDQNGKAVRSLGPDDFIVTARKQTRKVLTADFVELKPPAGARAALLPEPALAVSPASSNRTADRGRVFILAIDTGMIGLGDGRLAMQQVSDFLDHLAPEDVVGLAALPSGTPRVELTRDRAPIREALHSVVGMSHRYNACSHTYGEAAAISAGDAKSARQAMDDRLGPPPRRCAGGTEQINVVLPEYRMRTRALLDSLGALSDAMQSFSGLKTIVLIAEGEFVDRDNRDDIARLAARTEAAGTRVYALHLDTPVLDIRANGNVTTTHHLDDHYGFDAMADVAVATGGTAFRVIGSAIPVLDRIDVETSGYYVLGIDVDPADGDKPVELSVKTRRPGLDVRARRMFTTRPAPAARRPSTTDGDALAVAQLLQSPIDAGEIPIDVDTVRSSTRSSGTAQRVMIVADISAPPGEISAIGFHVATTAGRSIAYKIESPVVLADEGGAPYLVALDLEPGSYRLRLACVRQNGARGSIERLFTVRSLVDRSALSEILLGADNTSPWKPIAAPAPGQKRLGVRIEVTPAVADAASLTAKLLIGRAGEDTWIDSADLAIAGDETRRTATGAINVDQLRPGTYVIKVELWRNGALAAFTAKPFTIR